MSAKIDFLCYCSFCDDPCCSGDIIVSEEERGKILAMWGGPDPFRYNPRYDYHYLEIEECPLLTEEKLCAVHPVRPTICLLYPYSLVPVKGGGFRLTLDRSCPAAPSLPSEGKRVLREKAARLLRDVGYYRYLAFYEDWE